jgi:RNA polymerase sigma-70 factor (ECF subfamily)
MQSQRTALHDFKEIFQTHYPGMVRVALMYVRNLQAAEDIVQDVFVRFWEAERYKAPPEHIGGYLMTAVKNSSLNHLKHLEVEEKFCQEYVREAEADGESPEEYLKLVERLLEELPAKRREVLEMSVVESKSYREIADLLNLSVNTVKDHIKKAYAFLRERAQQEVPKLMLYLACLRKKRFNVS